MDHTAVSLERDRWFLWVPPILALGIAVYFKQLDEPGWPVTLAPLAIFALLGCLLRQNRFATIVHIGLIAAIGFAAAKLRTESVRAPVLVQTLRSADVVGVLELVERRQGGGKRLTLAVQKITGLAPQWTPARIRIRARKVTKELAPGQTIRVRARLAPPPSPSIPRGYDFARAAYFQGLGAVGYSLAEPKIIAQRSNDSSIGGIAIWLQRLRQDIGQRIEAALPGEVGAIANALMTGERSGISEETNDLYRDAGIFHILSISGMHMAIMGGAVFATLRFVFAAIPGIALNFPIKKWAAAAAGLATFGYLLISGGAYPTVRSFLMILIMFLAIILDRPAIALRNVAWAALVILIVMPESLFNAGFQLSFAAVVALVAAYEAHRERTQRRRRLGLSMPPTTGVLHSISFVWAIMAGTVATTLIAGAATAPFSAYHFHTAQLYSVLTNLLAIPVSNLVVMPAALASFLAMPFGLEGWPLALMGWGIDAMTWSATTVAKLSGAVATIPAFAEPALQLMVAGGLWLCLWRRSWRWLGLAAIIVGVWLASEVRRPAVLIGRDGALVALRGTDGKLVAREMRRAHFEMSRWLEHDGDQRKPSEVWSADRRKASFRCDITGCTGLAGPRKIAMPRSYAALVDDCRRADILILTFPKPPGCTTSALVIDFAASRRSGVHALYLDSDKLHIETVEQFRGRRPWTVATRLQRQKAYWRDRRAASLVKSKSGQAVGNPARRKSRRFTSEERPELEGGHPLYWFN